VQLIVYEIMAMEARKYRTFLKILVYFKMHLVIKNGLSVTFGVNHKTLKTQIR